MTYTITYGYGDYIRIFLTASSCAKTIVKDFKDFGYSLDYYEVLDKILDNAVNKRYFIWCCPDEIGKKNEDLTNYIVRKVEMEV